MMVGSADPDYLDTISESTRILPEREARKSMFTQDAGEPIAVITSGRTSNTWCFLTRETVPDSLRRSVVPRVGSSKHKLFSLSCVQCETTSVSRLFTGFLEVRSNRTPPYQMICLAKFSQIHGSSCAPKIKLSWR